MGRLPEGKVALSIYVTPRCKEKLDCLQRLYAVAGRSFSLSKIVEESVNFIYNAAYLCLDNVFWTAFFQLFKILGYEDGLKEGVSETLKVVKSKRSAAEEVLTVPLAIKGNFWKEYIKELKSSFVKK